MEYPKCASSPVPVSSAMSHSMPSASTWATYLVSLPRRFTLTCVWWSTLHAAGCSTHSRRGSAGATTRAWPAGSLAPGHGQTTHTPGSHEGFSCCCSSKQPACCCCSYCSPSNRQIHTALGPLDSPVRIGEQAPPLNHKAAAAAAVLPLALPGLQGQHGGRRRGSGNDAQPACCRCCTAAAAAAEAAEYNSCGRQAS